MFQQNTRVLDTLRSGHFDSGRGRSHAFLRKIKYTVVPLDTNVGWGCTSAILVVLLFELRKTYSSPFTEQELHPEVSSEVKVDPGSSNYDTF